MQKKKNNSLPKLITIVGSTATGKTKLAVKLASKFNGEIVSADSQQIYKNMDIGTGKDLEEFGKIKYYMVNIVKPNQTFNVAKYKKEALKNIYKIIKKGKIPILVGGTGLYLSAIIDNYDIPKIKPSKKIRQKLKNLSIEDKIKELKKLDPTALNIIDTKNPRRIDRALEICLSGVKFSEARKRGKKLFNILQIGLTLPKKELHKKIDKRVDKMIEQGLTNEVEGLIKKYGRNSAPLQTIGYREIIKNENNLEKAIEKIKIHTHQFAKRQMTWFKRDKNIYWIKDLNEAIKLVKTFL